MVTNSNSSTSVWCQYLDLGTGTVATAFHDSYIQCHSVTNIINIEWNLWITDTLGVGILSFVGWLSFSHCTCTSKSLCHDILTILATPVVTGNRSASAASVTQSLSASSQRFLVGELWELKFSINCNSFFRNLTNCHCSKHNVVKGILDITEFTSWESYGRLALHREGCQLQSPA